MGFSFSFTKPQPTMPQLGGVQEDEEAIDEAVDHMFQMAGNEGQVSILTRGVGDFWDWAERALEVEDDYTNYEDVIISAIGFDAYSGTIEIWQAGYDIMADQSGYHDGYDEHGEGTGREFS
jgi:hypothetical protein